MYLAKSSFQHYTFGSVFYIGVYSSIKQWRQVPFKLPRSLYFLYLKNLCFRSAFPIVQQPDLLYIRISDHVLLGKRSRWASDYRVRAVKCKELLWVLIADKFVSSKLYSSLLSHSFSLTTNLPFSRLFLMDELTFSPILIFILQLSIASLKAVLYHMHKASWEKWTNNFFAQLVGFLISLNL